MLYHTGPAQTILFLVTGILSVKELFLPPVVLLQEEEEEEDYGDDYEDGAPGSRRRRLREEVRYSGGVGGVWSYCVIAYPLSRILMKQEEKSTFGGGKGL